MVEAAARLTGLVFAILRGYGLDQSYERLVALLDAGLQRGAGTSTVG